MSPPHSLDWLALGTWDRSGVRRHEERNGIFRQIWQEIAAVLLRDKMNILLLLLPLSFVSHALRWPAGVTFVLSLLPLCSLAERLGMITEQLAMYTNDTLGGLLNATFGNATEVIIAAFAIKKGYLRVVKLTLLGSIIGNLLLVMGSAFVAGGLIHPSQTFNQQGINVNCGLLILSVVAVMLPTLISSTSTVAKDLTAELALSRFESVLMLVCYGLFLVFQLVTHRHLYDEGSGDNPSSSSKAAAAACGPEGTSCAADDEESLSFSLPHTGSRAAVQSALSTEVELMAGPPQRRGAGSSPRPVVANGGSSSSSNLVTRRLSNPESSPRSAAAAAAADSHHVQIGLQSGHADDDRACLVQQPPSVQVVEEEEDDLVLSWAGCFVWLALVTVLISLLSDYIMDAITEASKQLRVPMPFLTTIIVPLVGNAAEHASALIFAVKNRMEISLGVAMGSSTQVGVLVVPFCVVLAWTMGQPLDLNFNEFEALVLFISVLLAAVVVQDGTSNWLKGAMLVLTYLFIAAGFWVHKDPSLRTD